MREPTFQIDVTGLEDTIGIYNFEFGTGWVKQRKDKNKSKKRMKRRKKIGQTRKTSCYNDSSWPLSKTMQTVVVSFSLLHSRTHFLSKVQVARPATYINESKDTLLLASESKAAMVVRRPEGVSGSVAMAMCWDGYGGAAWNINPLASFP
ncbi:hypothetical protein M0804_005831 [Polistes exclamans]|nr:hypothetical protein M0804_005831 [Polistes exclamans]